MLRRSCSLRSKSPPLRQSCSPESPTPPSTPRHRRHPCAPFHRAVPLLCSARIHDAVVACLSGTPNPSLPRRFPIDPATLTASQWRIAAGQRGDDGQLYSDVPPSPQSQAISLTTVNVAVLEAVPKSV